MKSLPELDFRVFDGLAGYEAAVEIGALAAALSLDQAKVAAVCLSRAESGEVALTEKTVREFRLGGKAKAIEGDELPERAVVRALSQMPEGGNIPQVAQEAGLDKKAVGQCLAALGGKKWAANKKGTLALLPDGHDPAVGADEALFAALVQAGSALSDAEIHKQGLDADAALSLCKISKRKGFFDIRERKRRFVSLTDAGRTALAEAPPPAREVNQLTSEMMLTGAWQEQDGELVWTRESEDGQTERCRLRPYDVSLGAENTIPGREHPLVSVFAQTRKVFLEMGFSEIVSPHVESSFWDFDALFQPQDHPARDMQDTFYVERPGRCTLPPDEVVKAVARTHENGGDTGSVGWRYRWDKELAGRPVLRTHTTAATIRALANDPAPPRKVFCVGPVFRRETVDYKHLPIFHQVDGVIIDEHASLATLFGTLQAFYNKMGFTKFHFQPAFYPYTEPSVDVFVWSEAKKDWVEMGGAGVFRPEVTRPFGCKVPVLAWGLGMERLAMFRYDLPAIGELYRARLGWLKETPLCR